MPDSLFFNEILPIVLLLSSKSLFGFVLSLSLSSFTSLTKSPWSGLVWRVPTYYIWNVGAIVPLFVMLAQLILYLSIRRFPQVLSESTSSECKRSFISTTNKEAAGAAGSQRQAVFLLLVPWDAIVVDHRRTRAKSNMSVAKKLTDSLRSIDPLSWWSRRWLVCSISCCSTAPFHTSCWRGDRC
jgi:hypothetical protein